MLDLAKSDSSYRALILFFSRHFVNYSTLKSIYIHMSHIYINRTDIQNRYTYKHIQNRYT